MYKITIKDGKEKQIINHHPWVFTGAIKSVKPRFTSGDYAEVYTHDDTFIAYGWYDEKSSTTLHLLSWDKNILINDEYIKTLVKRAIKKRESFFDNNSTNAFRLIHGEADFLPGIVVDYYNGELRVVLSSRFAEHFLPLLIETLEDEIKPKLIQVSSDPLHAKSEGISGKIRIYKDGIEINNPAERDNTFFLEDGIYYALPPGIGQKSGFYCDQRENRKIVEKYAKDKTVLDLCSFTGAFTLHSLKGGAKSVDAVDSSEDALRHLLYQIHLNEDNNVLPPLSRDKVTIKVANAFNYIREIEENKFDLMILDPPKLAPTKGKLEKAINAYKDLNRVAFLKIKDGGLIATFSCSSAMTREKFLLTLSWAAKDANVDIEILETLSSPSDHPIRLSFPESEYLTGYILRVNKIF